MSNIVDFPNTNETVTIPKSHYDELTDTLNLAFEKYKNEENEHLSYINVVFGFLQQNNLGEKFLDFIKDLKDKAELDNDLYDAFGNIDYVLNDTKLIWGKKEAK